MSLNQAEEKMTTAKFQEWLTDMATELTSGKMFATETMKKYEPLSKTGSKTKQKKASH